MPTNFLWAAGTSNNGLLTTAVSLMTTELQSLTTGSYIVSSVNGSSGLFTNANTAQGMGADLFFMVGNPGIGSALLAGANLSGWFLTSPDGGTTFEPTTTAVRPPDFIIPMPATTITANAVYKSIGVQGVLIPSLEFKVLAQNNTGQAFGNGGTTAPWLRAAITAMQY